MNAHQRPHYIIKPAEIADWLDREPGTWWIVHGDPRLGGKVDFPCPSGELSSALRGYSKDIFLYTLPAGPMQSRPHGQTINSQGLNDLSDTDNPEHRRTFLLAWSDRDGDWMLAEYPSSRLPEVTT